ncbi:MAG: transposase [Candidatus Pacebacteria bacterium]|nr:transposase [Candidatus Paceibacterota bacterium]
METENKFKNIYRIKSARKLGYDYANDGWYFVTICTKNMEQFFGNITDGKMNLSEIGKIVENYWLEIPKHFPFVELDEFSFMPNHNHGIIGINNFCRDAIYRVSTTRDDDNSFNRANRDAINRVSTGGVTGKNNPMGKNGLGEIIRWYKGRCKFEIGKMKCDNFAWQPRFYDRIIRNEKELNKIRKYIFENVLKWEFDKNNIENF